MFKVNDRVIEIGTSARGVVIDIDTSIEKPYGVLFEDVDGDRGVWWCDSNMIVLDTASTYNVDEFVHNIYNVNS